MSAETTCAPAHIEFDRAQAIVVLEATPLGPERVLLAKAGGRTLCEPVMARIDAPRFDCAAMDGYALRNADLLNGIRQFRCGSQVFAGDEFDPTPSSRKKPEES